MKPLFTILASLVLIAGAFGANEKPHIVFVLADDLGFGDLGCYGGANANTPNIDRLAREGTLFTGFYVTAPICSPSRCGLITGNFPLRWSITSFLQAKAGNRLCEQADFLDPAAPSLPRALKAAGYTTAHIGKWHLGGGRDVSDPPLFSAYGYDDGVGTWESPEPHPDITATDWIWSQKDPVKRWERCGFFVDKTLEFIERHKDKPCFVNLWFDDPHTPWVPDSTPVKTGERHNSPPRLARVLVELDRQVGRLLAALPENTLVIFASDNGPAPTFNGERTVGLRGSKLSLYEGGIRMPFIVRWTGHTQASRVDNTTILSSVDMLPTICAIAGAPTPPHAQLDGQDMSEALFGKPIVRTKPLFWEYGRNTKSFAYPSNRDRSPAIAMREGKWKLLINSDGSEKELYDLESDPTESENVAADQLELTKRLTKAALDWYQSRPPLPVEKR